MGVKRTNRSAVLHILHEKETISRKRLAEDMKLTPAAITKIVGEMLNEGLLVEGDTINSGTAGRREINVSLNPHRYCALGILINTNRAVASASWLDGTVLFSKTIEIISPADADDTVIMLSRMLMELVENNKIERETIIGLGIAVRGIISEDRRYIVNSFGALADANYPICDRFEELTGINTILSNNVRALFLAQLFLTRDNAEETQFFMRCEYGIGASLSINNQLWTDVYEQNAEIGHIPVMRSGGKPCSCGKSGCLETIASPAAICDEALAILSEEKTPVLWKIYCEKSKQGIDIDDVLNAASCGDSGASAIVDRAVETLCGALKSVIYIINPSKIVLYGRIFENQVYLSKLKREMHIGVDSRHDVTVEKSEYNNKLDSVAASLLAVEDFFANGGIVR